MKILDDKSLDKELNLYVEAQGKQSSDVDSEPFEVTYGIQKHLLGPESKLRVLLLTGQAGIGKTVLQAPPKSFTLGMGSSASRV